MFKLGKSKKIENIDDLDNLNDIKDLGDIDELNIDDINLDEELDFSFEDKTKYSSLRNALLSKIKEDYSVDALKDIVTQILPKNLRYNISNVESDLYDFRKYIREEIYNFRKSSANLLSEIKNIIPYNIKFIDALYEKLKPQYEEGTFVPKSEEEIIRSDIDSTISKIFGSQEDNLKLREIIRKTDEDTKEVINIRNTKITHSLLSSIDESISKIASFNLTVQYEYYKKMLELKIRDIYAQERIKQISIDTYSLLSLKLKEIHDALIISQGEKEPDKVKTSFFSNLLSLFKQKISDFIKPMTDVMDNLSMFLSLSSSLSSIENLTPEQRKNKFLASAILFPISLKIDDLKESLSNYVNKLVDEKSKEEGRIGSIFKSIKAMSTSLDEYLYGIKENLEKEGLQYLGVGKESISSSEILSSIDRMLKNISSSIIPKEEFNIKIEDRESVDTLTTTKANFDRLFYSTVVYSIPSYLSKMTSTMIYIKNILSKKFSKEAEEVDEKEFVFDILDRTMKEKKDITEDIGKKLYLKEKTNIDEALYSIRRKVDVNFDDLDKIKEKLKDISNKEKVTNIGDLFMEYITQGKIENQDYRKIEASFSSIKEIEQLRKIVRRKISKNRISAEDILKYYEEEKTSYLGDSPIKEVEELFNFISERFTKKEYKKSIISIIADAILRYYVNTAKIITFNSITSLEFLNYADRKSITKEDEFISYITDMVRVFNMSKDSSDVLSILSMYLKSINERLRYGVSSIISLSKEINKYLSAFPWLSKDVNIMSNLYIRTSEKVESMSDIVSEISRNLRRPESEIDFDKVSISDAIKNTIKDIKAKDVIKLGLDKAKEGIEFIKEDIESDIEIMREKFNAAKDMVKEKSEEVLNKLDYIKNKVSLPESEDIGSLLDKIRSFVSDSILKKLNQAYSSLKSSTLYSSIMSMIPRSKTQAEVIEYSSKFIDFINDRINEILKIEEESKNFILSKLSSIFNQVSDLGENYDAEIHENIKDIFDNRKNMINYIKKMNSNIKNMLSTLDINDKDNVSQVLSHLDSFISDLEKMSE